MCESLDRLLFHISRTVHTCRSSHGLTVLNVTLRGETQIVSQGGKNVF